MVETGIRKVEKKESTLFSARHTYNANSIWPLRDRHKLGMGGSHYHLSCFICQFP